MHSRAMMLVVLSIAVLYGCEEKVVYRDDPRLYNDAYHGNIVGKVKQSWSGAKVIVSQIAPVDSTIIDQTNGTFRLENLPIGNYDLTITADNYGIYTLSNVMVNGAGTTYIGTIDLSTVPNLVSTHYPDDLDEILYSNRYNRLTVSVTFTRPMDRESVESAFSTVPPTDGTFYWGSYSTQPRPIYYYHDKGGANDDGAVITTYSKITSFSYVIAQKDCHTDTTYSVTLTTAAQDTAGNHLRIPLEFSFSTIQSSSTMNSIQSIPDHGDIDVELISNSGIQITFPRKMDPATTEAAITVTPESDCIYIWPEKNKLTVYTGGVYEADTMYEVEIGASAEDLDGIPLGNPYTFSFTTAPVGVRTTTPRNGELFVNIDKAVTVWFNTYMVKSTIEDAFSISPEISGSIRWGTESSSNDKTALTFNPKGMINGTKYTVTIGTEAADLYGAHTKEPYTFSFVTRPE